MQNGLMEAPGCFDAHHSGLNMAEDVTAQQCTPQELPAEAPHQPVEGPACLTTAVGSISCQYCKVAVPVAKLHDHELWCCRRWDCAYCCTYDWGPVQPEPQADPLTGACSVLRFPVHGQCATCDHSTSHGSHCAAPLACPFNGCDVGIPRYAYGHFLAIALRVSYGPNVCPIHGPVQKAAVADVLNLNISYSCNLQRRRLAALILHSHSIAAELMQIVLAHMPITCAHCNEAVPLTRLHDHDLWCQQRVQCTYCHQDPGQLPPAGTLHGKISASSHSVHNSAQCPQIIACPSMDCNQAVPRHSIERHLQQCPHVRRRHPLVGLVARPYITVT